MSIIPPERAEGPGEQHLERARVLLDQSRADLAERELRRALAQEPNDPEAHALLALCLAERDALEEARREAAIAVRLAPDEALCHRAMAEALVRANRLPAAELAAQEALRLAPHDPDMYACLAEVRAFRRDWKGSLEVAERGLALDPEHVGCANVRGQALVYRGRRSEAVASLGATVAIDPVDAITHANRGWANLHAGDHPPALEHFQAALRLDPDLEWAREGLVQALKARNRLYRVALRVLLWMTRIPQWVHIAVAITMVLAVRVIFPPLFALWFAFMYLAWVTGPVSDLLLSLSRAGRMALARDDLVVARLVGACIAGAVAFAIASSYKAHLLVTAATVATIALPAIQLFETYPGGRRVRHRSMGALIVAVAMLAAASAALILAGDAQVRNVGIGVAATGIFLALISPVVLEQVNRRQQRL